MTRTFFFIDGIEASKSSKRLMRRHVMQGKNAGKTLHRPSRLKRRPSVCQMHDVVAATETSITRRPRQEEKSPRRRRPVSRALTSRPKPLGNGFALCWLPVEVTGDSLEVIHEFFVYTSFRLYSGELGLSMDEAKSLWLPTMFADEATYYCSIDMMRASNEIVSQSGSTNICALYHLSRTFSHVKKRLQSADALSDSTIAIIMTLISQEQLRRQDAAAQVHARGLQQIIQLRGGLSALEANRGLVIKVCKTDILLALQHGGATMFFRDHMSDAEKTLALQGIRLKRTAVSYPIWIHSIQPDLRGSFVDVTAVCNLLNQRSGTGSMDLVTSQEILFSMLYRLLRFRCLDEAQKILDSLSALHLGLIMLLMTIFLQHSSQKILEFKLIDECFKAVVGNAVKEGTTDLALWLMLIGGIWNSRGADWLARSLQRAAQGIGVLTWIEARAAICELPWINVLHDKPGEALWQSVHSCFG